MHISLMGVSCRPYFTCIYKFLPQGYVLGHQEYLSATVSFWPATLLKEEKKYESDSKEILITYDASTPIVVHHEDTPVVM